MYQAIGNAMTEDMEMQRKILPELFTFHYFSLITSPPPRLMQEIRMMDVLFDQTVPSLRELRKIGDRYRFCMRFSLMSCT
jgi:hypothetical protein